MAKIESWFDCDLKRPVQVQVLSGNVFSLDNNGSRIGVKFYDNGQKTTVTGSVSGRFILANGQTIDAITGTLATVNGQSVAYLDVPQSVLHVPGPLKITIQLTDSSVVTTVAAILATVYQTKTDDEIVPSQQVIDDWNAAITQAIGTQNLAIANQDAKIDDLKSALNDVAYARQITPVFVTGKFFYNNGTYGTSANTEYTKPFIIKSGEKCVTKCKLYDSSGVTLRISDENGKLIENIGFGNNTVKEYSYTNKTGHDIYMQASGYIADGITINVWYSKDTFDTLLAHSPSKKIDDAIGGVNVKEGLLFTVGTLDGSAVVTENTNRIVTPNINVHSFDAYIPDMNNVRVILATYNSSGEAVTCSEISLPYTISVGTRYKLSLFFRRNETTITDPYNNDLYREFEIYDKNYKSEGDTLITETNGIGNIRQLPDKWITGYGANDYSTTYNVIRTAYMKFHGGKLLVQPTSDYRFKIIAVDSSGTTVENTDWAFRPAIFEDTSDWDKYMVCAQKRDASEINLANGNKLISLYYFSHSDIQYKTEWFLGGIDGNGELTNATTRACTKLMRFDCDVVMRVMSSDYRIMFVAYNEGTRIGSSSWTRRDTVIPAGTQFIAMVVANDPDEDLTSQLSTIINNIVFFEEPSNYLSRLPEYYYANSYIENKASQIKALIEECASDGDVFGFITDIHLDQAGHEANVMRSPIIINYLSNKFKLPRVFCGGDLEDGCTHYVPDMYRKYFDGDFIVTPGNHEYLYGSNNTEDDVFITENMEISEKAVGNSKRNYYYIDNKLQKIRYIMLNGWAEADEGNFGFEEEQMNWLQNTALNVDSGWTILIFTHCIYVRDNESRYVFRPAIFATDLISILDNYNGNGEIAAVFSGHVHTDRVIRTPGGIPNILTTCDFYVDQDTGVSRSVANITETAFDIVVLNKKIKKFTIVRIGAKALDTTGTEYASGNEVEYREVTYGNQSNE